MKKTKKKCLSAVLYVSLMNIISVLAMSFLAKNFELMMQFIILIFIVIDLTSTYQKESEVSLWLENKTIFMYLICLFLCIIICVIILNIHGFYHVSVMNFKFYCYLIRCIAVAGTKPCISKNWIVHITQKTVDSSIVIQYKTLKCYKHETFFNKLLIFF